MGRRARKRAVERDQNRHHGVAGESPEPPEAVPSRCPRCGSTNLVTGPYMAGITQGVDVVCGHCNWHGMIEPGIW
jgi:hypothetical protein